MSNLKKYLKEIREVKEMLMLKDDVDSDVLEAIEKIRRFLEHLEEEIRFGKHNSKAILILINAIEFEINKLKQQLRR